MAAEALDVARRDLDLGIAAAVSGALQAGIFRTYGNRERLRFWHRVDRGQVSREFYARAFYFSRITDPLAWAARSILRCHCLNSQSRFDCCLRKPLLPVRARLNSKRMTEAP